jgi:hypothetical protein
VFGVDSAVHHLRTARFVDVLERVLRGEALWRSHDGKDCEQKRRSDNKTDRL